MFMYVMLSYSFDFALFMSYFELFIALFLYYGNPTCLDLVKFTFRLILLLVNSWLGIKRVIVELFLTYFDCISQFIFVLKPWQ